MAAHNFDYCIGTANSAFKKVVSGMLNSSGFISAGDGTSTPLLLRTLRSVQPWLAVIDTELPPGNIEELADIIEADNLSAAIFISTRGRSLKNYVQLDWPVEPRVLTAVAEAVCNEFARKKKLQNRINDLQRKLNERKLIEKAKGIIADNLGFNEADAYNYLREKSMERRISMAEMAGLVVTAPGLFS
ncbi:MAG: ANTAR domain-containing protein [Bacillota bacterium]|nr:ANTAR domain-containing protein [Bacillota bacterium]